jgi:AcrR family transcriptional regulator
LARTPDVGRRRQLLDALIDEFASGGIGDRSLRDVADAVGTSHRMLLHHFVSRDEMLLAIVEEVERRQMAVLSELPTDPGESFAAMWDTLCRPELRPFERLFFECYSRGAQGEEPFARMVPSAVEGPPTTRLWCGWVLPSPADSCSTWWPRTTTRESPPPCSFSQICSDSRDSNSRRVALLTL